MRKMQIRTTGTSEAWFTVPVPKGPYIIVSQHHYDTINKLDKADWQDALEMTFRTTWYDEFDLHFGHLTYANVEGKAKCIGAYLDTSD